LVLETTSSNQSSNYDPSFDDVSKTNQSPCSQDQQRQQQQQDGGGDGESVGSTGTHKTNTTVLSTSGSSIFDEDNLSIYTQNSSDLESLCLTLTTPTRDHPFDTPTTSIPTSPTNETSLPTPLQPLTVLHEDLGGSEVPPKGKMSHDNNSTLNQQQSILNKPPPLSTLHTTTTTHTSLLGEYQSMNQSDQNDDMKTREEEEEEIRKMDSLLPPLLLSSPTAATSTTCPRKKSQEDDYSVKMSGGNKEDDLTSSNEDEQQQMTNLESQFSTGLFVK